MRFLKDNRGATAVEFAVVMPVLVLIMVAVSDLAFAAQRSIRLEAAARAAAQFAFNGADWQNNAVWSNAGPNTPVPTNAQTVARQVITALSGDPVATSVPGVSVTIRRSCFCDNSPKVCGTGGTEDTCVDAVTSEILPTTRYVAIEVQDFYSPLLLTFLTPASGRVELRLR